MVTPKALNPGDTIAVIAPASPQRSSGRLERGIEYLQNRGYRVRAGKFIHEQQDYLAGSDRQRLDDLHWAFADPDVKAVFCTRGGYGSPRLLDSVDYDLIGNNPKIFVGFSDITALQTAILAKCGLISFSGPMVSVDFADDPDPFSEQLFWSMITGSLPSKAEIPLGGRTLVPGVASGRLVGGTLSLLTGILGTIYSPDYSDAILFTEDIGEEPYRVDRMLNQMRLAGILERSAALMFGSFSGVDATKVNTPWRDYAGVISEYAAVAGVPVAIDISYGHTARKLTMPVGLPATISFGDNVVLSFSVPPCR